MLGGLCLIAAAVSVTFVRDAGGSVPEQAVVEADEHEPLTVQGSVQPVPSSGLAGERR